MWVVIWEDKSKATSGRQPRGVVSRYDRKKVLPAYTENERVKYTNFVCEIIIGRS
jgi:hypothetical protein